MRSLVVGIFLGWVAVAGAAENWLRTLPPEQFVAAGLDKLTPAELDALARLVAARAAPANGGSTQSAAGQRVASPPGPTWLRALLTLQGMQENPDAAEAIESRLAGDYRGWNGRTVFQLENGQVWQQVSGGERFDDPRPAPDVKIYPGLLGVFWLEIEGVNDRVKVKPIKLR